MKLFKRMRIGLLVMLSWHTNIEFSLSASTSEEDKRANILFIVVDDQSPFDLQVYNPLSILDTPVISQLAADGMALDAAYHMGAWTGGVCTPSRHMIMSGRTLWHIPDKPGRMNNPHITNPQLVPPDLAWTHAARRLDNEAGYDTMRTCKNGNSYEEANKLFAVRHDGTRRGASDEKGSPWHTKQVLEYLQSREDTKDSNPFLIYFGFSHPHDTRDGRTGAFRKIRAVNHADKKHSSSVEQQTTATSDELPPCTSF